MALQFHALGDVVWYLPENEEDLRMMLNRKFGSVCKEHGGKGDRGEVWGYWSYSKRGNIMPCFVRGTLDPDRRLPLLFTLAQQQEVYADEETSGM